MKLNYKFNRNIILLLLRRRSVNCFARRACCRGSTHFSMCTFFHDTHASLLCECHAQFPLCRSLTCHEFLSGTHGSCKLIKNYNRAKTVPCNTHAQKTHKAIHYKGGALKPCQRLHTNAPLGTGKKIKLASMAILPTHYMQWHLQTIGIQTMIARKMYITRCSLPE